MMKNLWVILSDIWS